MKKMSSADSSLSMGTSRSSSRMVGGRTFTTSCHASMVDGFQEGDEIECPLHEGRFNIKTGEALCAPVTDALKVFEVKVEGDDILVKV